MKRKCGAIWFVSRKMTTSELNSINLSTVELKKATAKDR